ncbi:anaphase-promoting complex subunit 4 isoform X1 [Dendrobium catenatum]|uniref:anaphase-promoting complex subunit 4 isoform X1 n=1 Tax=Dendrobium catenatum TaxID=906689 RepID=UPI0009F1F62D|nr:anaphase-promoting complex subunit 4 isoform X1 [Dendrobium catenatum]
MVDDEGVEMETEGGSQGGVPFQLQFDKPIPSQVKIAEWNPEKDLLAMVTEDNKIILHRFNWQRLWALFPGKGITSLCWRPDGKAIALGLDDGTISLHDVENGKLLRAVKTHSVAVICLNWEEVAQTKSQEENNLYSYEDRTMRFFPSSPRIPRMRGLGAGDSGLADDSEDSFQELSNCSYQHFNVLCSGDKDGYICFSAFGIFRMGKINIRNLSISTPALDDMTDKLRNASIQKVALSKTLCQLIVLCSGEVVGDIIRTQDECVFKDDGFVEVGGPGPYFGSSTGLHCMLLNTSIFLSRKNELHQVAQQASNIDHLIEVIRESLSLMSKQWFSAMNSFNEKFSLLSSLIISHGGLDWNPQDEFLSLLFGARTSPPLHQFLVNSLGEAGLKRVSKAVCGAGKELHVIIHEHLQPAVETMGFRVGELRGLSRWHSRFKNIGLDERLIETATEKTGMFLVQVERFARVLTVVIQLFQNFFNWVLKCIKILMPEPTDQIQQPNSELVVLFLKYIFDQDPVGQFLENSDGNHSIVTNPDTRKLIEELVAFGGFSDVGFLERTLSMEFDQLEQCFKEAFLMPFATVSKKIYCEDFLPLFPSPASTISTLNVPTSISYYKDDFDAVSNCETSLPCLLDYICFRIPDESLHMANCIGILKGLTCNSRSTDKGSTSLAALVLHIPEGYRCVDLSLYKENQLILLLSESISVENLGQSWMMMLQMNSLPFVSISRSFLGNLWNLHEVNGSAVELNLSRGKVRCIPHMVTTPLAVSASRGVASVFSARKHALVYILDEDEDEVSDME